MQNFGVERYYVIGSKLSDRVGSKEGVETISLDS